MSGCVLDRSPTDVHQVTAHMLAEFAGALPAAAVRSVVLTARADLGREVPAEAMDEFLHRLAWQRLVDLQPGVRGARTGAIYQQKGRYGSPGD